MKPELAVCAYRFGGDRCGLEGRMCPGEWCYSDAVIRAGGGGLSFEAAAAKLLNPFGYHRDEDYEAYFAFLIRAGRQQRLAAISNGHNVAQGTDR